MSTLERLGDRPGARRAATILLPLLLAGCGDGDDAAGVVQPRSLRHRWAAVVADAGIDAAVDAGIDAAVDAALDSAVDDAGQVAPAVELYGPPDGGDASIASIAVSPLTLVPSFSPDVDDYYVRCPAGGTAVTLTVTNANGVTSELVDLLEDQALVVGGQYWIRCLPHDFPAITVSHPSNGSPTPGYYLLNTPGFAIVLDVRGTPVWYARGSSVLNVDAQQANLISYMPAGTGPYGTSASADFELFDLEQQTTTYVRASGSPTDPHELLLLANGDYLVFTYPTKSGVNLTGLKSFGAGAYMAECEIQEVGPTGQLVWTWVASDHVDPVTESVEPALNTIGGLPVVDVFHCNSIDVDPTGNLLLSMRHANAVFYIDRTTGAVLWKLGGTPTNKDVAKIIGIAGDPEGAFDMQHDARFRPNGDVSLFDDHGAAPGVARGVEYSVDVDAGTATMVWQFLGNNSSQYEGSFRRYDDGESVIGWGGSSPDPRVVTEVDSDGNDVLDVTFSPVAEPYRAVKVAPSMLDLSAMRLTAGR
jgi:hypothetical protein